MRRQNLALVLHEIMENGPRSRASIAEGRADVVTCQRIAARRAVDQGMAIGGEAAAVAPDQSGSVR